MISTTSLTQHVIWTMGQIPKSVITMNSRYNNSTTTANYATSRRDIEVMSATLPIPIVESCRTL